MRKKIALLAVALAVVLSSVPVGRADPTEAAYTVEHWCEDLQGQSWDLAERETLRGEAGTVSQAEARVYEGFTAQPFSQTRIRPDGESLVQIYYTRNSYMLTWSTDGDPLTGSYTSGRVAFGSAVRAPETPTKQGYTFAGWSSAVAATMPAAYTVYTAQWIPNDNTPYTVSHFLRGLEGTGYTLLETEQRTGFTDAYTAAVARTITGFSSLPFRQTVIAADGSTAVSLFYDRERYTLVWDPAGGALKGSYTSGSVLYGTPILVPTVERNGYDFAGWNTEAAERMPAAYTVYTARWTARPYIIQYQLAGGSLPEGQSNPERYTDETPDFTLCAPVRPGYTFVGWIGTGLSEPTDTVTVQTARGLDLSFTAVWRANRYSVTLHPNGGTVGSGAVSGYTAGVGAVLPTDVTRAGHVFEGWYADGQFSGSAVSGIGTEETGDREFWAKWTERSGSAYTVRHYQQAKNGSGYTLFETETLSGPAGELTAAAAKGYAGFTAKAVTQAPIRADGGTVIGVYYDRNFFTLAWEPRGGALSGSYSQGPTRYGADIVTPLVSRPDYRFDGWFEDADCTVAWNGDSCYTGTALTLYAKWIRLDALHLVQVQVFARSEEGSVVTDAAVELRRGGEVYRSLACVGGIYSAADVPDGDYSVVVTSADGRTTATTALRVDGADPALCRVVLPLGSVSTAVEIGPGAPSVTVLGLENVAADPEVIGPQAQGQDVVLKLMFDVKESVLDQTDDVLSTQELASKAAQSRIRLAAVNDLGEEPELAFYSIRLLRITTDGEGNTVTEEITDTGDQVLTITIPYCAGTDDFSVYRDHVAESGAVSTTQLTRTALRTGPHMDGTCYLDDDAVIVYSSKFSAIGMATVVPSYGTIGGAGGTGGTGTDGTGGTGDTGGGMSGGTGGTGTGGSGTSGYSSYGAGRTRLPVNVRAADGGAVQTSAGSAYPGDTVTLTVSPEEGYALDTLSVRDRNGGTVPVSVRSGNQYFFIMPDSGVTVTGSFLPATERFGNTGVANRLITDAHLVFLKGFEDGTVRPGGSITRAEVATIFYRLVKDRDVPVTAGFSDVAKDRWYTAAVETLASLGIVNGVGDDRFEPDRSITRAEFTAIACRFANMIDSELRFTDVPETHWAARYIACAAGYGWVEGYGDGRFGPSDPMTRAQAVAIVNRMLGRVADRAYILAHRDTLIAFTDLTDETRWYYFDIYEAANAHSFTVAGGEERWET